LLVSDTGGYRLVLYPPSFSGIMRGLMRKRILTEEEKAAKKIATLVNDITLDLDSVGIYLARYSPTISYNRLMLIAESAEFEKENIDVRHSHEPLF
jgi:hypothetical protein